MQRNQPVRPWARTDTRAAGALLCGLLVCGLLAGCGPTSFLVTPMPAARELDEHIVQSESFFALSKIALIDVDGMLHNDRAEGLLSGPGQNPVALFVEKLHRAEHDRAVKAVVLRINSPGGTVTASDIMYQEVQRFRQRSHKPVVAAMQDVAASGAYYVACATDEIYAQPTTITGSIGVIVMLPEFSGTMHKLGVAMNVIKSAELKDAGSMFRTMSERDRAVFQELVDGMYARFVQIVGQGRKDIPADRVKELANGRVWLAPEARELGLVDEIGGLPEAIAAAKKLAGIPNRAVKVVQYAWPVSYRPNVYAQAAATEVNVVNIPLPEWATGPAPRLMYLWAPGW